MTITAEVDDLVLCCASKEYTRRDGVVHHILRVWSRNLPKVDFRCVDSRVVRTAEELPLSLEICGRPTEEYPSWIKIRCGDFYAKISDLRGLRITGPDMKWYGALTKLSSFKKLKIINIKIKK